MLEDMAAERVVICGAYANSDVYCDIEPIVQVNTFTDEVNQAVFKSIKKIRDEDIDTKIDSALLFSTLREVGHADIANDPDNKKYIRNLLQFSVEPSNVRKFAAKIRKLEISRLLSDQLTMANEEVCKITGNERVDEILGIAENRIFDFTSLLNDEDGPAYVHMSVGAREYFDYLINNVCDLVGISTGYKELDKFWGGLRRKAVNVIAASSGIGKSMFCDNIALHVAKILKIPVLYLDTEMDQQGHFHRLWANLSSVSQDEIETGKFSRNSSKMSRVQKSMEEFTTAPYFYKNVAGKPFEEILSIARKWLVKEVGKDINGKTKDCLLVYDYMKLMTADSLHGNLQEYQIMGFQMTGLHNFSVKHDIPILTAVQLNREGGISQSERIKWLSSGVAVYERKTDEEIRASSLGNMKTSIIKSRYGKCTSFNEYINYSFIGQYARITENNLSTAPPQVQASEFPVTDEDSNVRIEFN